MIKKIKNELLSMQDKTYKDFHSKLMPTINSNSIIGVRVPVLRDYAKKLFKENSIESLNSFLKNLPHEFYEENNIHAFLIEKINNFDECIFYLENFLPYIDNWATCDMLNPKIFKTNYEKLLEKIYQWINSDTVYTVRFAIGMLMRYFLDEKFETKYLDLVVSINSEEYYINMMRAWFFATALAKQYEQTFPYIKNYSLDEWTHNKTIQKAKESFRITKDQKEELKKFRL
ncbi:MAG: DNA alkylation repair protein [Treponemataceae bacterium]|nr:DNA alkylation repair protein [Treponemataceae bacterium]